MTTTEQDYWIAEGRIRQINADLQAAFVRAIDAIEAAKEAAHE